MGENDGCAIISNLPANLCDWLAEYIFSSAEFFFEKAANFAGGLLWLYSNRVDSLSTTRCIKIRSGRT